MAGPGEEEDEGGASVAPSLCSISSGVWTAVTKGPVFPLRDDESESTNRLAFENGDTENVTLFCSDFIFLSSPSFSFSSESWVGRMG